MDQLLEVLIEGPKMSFSIALQHIEPLLGLAQLIHFFTALKYHYEKSTTNC
jgi:hypothetical protein